MIFEITRNNRSIDVTTLLDHYPIRESSAYKNKSAGLTGPLPHNTLAKWYPDEISDTRITSLYSPDKIHYISLFGMDEGGELPDDLTPTEMLLTRLLWGEVDRFMAILCVAAVEDMSIEDVTKSLRKMNLF